MCVSATSTRRRRTSTRETADLLRREEPHLLPFHPWEGNGPTRCPRNEARVDGCTHRLPQDVVGLPDGRWGEASRLKCRYPGPHVQLPN